MRHLLFMQSKFISNENIYEDSAEYLYFREKQNDRLYEKINALRSPEKEILKMRIYQKKAFPDIAKELNLNYHTVRSQYQRSIKKIKRILEENDYERICKKGKPLCKIIDAETKRTLDDASFDFNNRSILFEMGYNVQASCNLTIAERQSILKKAIEEKAISVNAILNLLELQIHLHSSDDKYITAVEKWKEDSDFVRQYGLQSGRIKHITDIKV